MADEKREKIEYAIRAATESLELQVLGEIADTLKDMDESTTIVQAVAKVPAGMQRIEKAVSGGADEIAAAGISAVDMAARENEEWAKPYYEAAGIAPTAAASEVLDEIAKETGGKIKAVCQTKALGLAEKKGTGFIPLRQAYIDIVTEAATEMSAGRVDRQGAVKRAVSRLSNGGLRVVSYDNGAQHVRELHSAVTANVRDAYAHAMSEGRRVAGEEFGADGVEVSAHGLCAPDHVHYQGKQFGKAEFEKIQGRLERPIGEGYNCRHIVYPVILGVSEPALSEKERALYERMSEREVTISIGGNEKTVTAYEATQMQRQLETAIRKAKTEEFLLDKAGADTAQAAQRVKGLEKRYRSVSKQAGIGTQMERTNIYFRR